MVRIQLFDVMRLLQLLRRLRQSNLLVFLARGAGIAFVLQLSGFGLSYLVQVLIARWIGPTEYGTYDYVMAWSSLVAIVAELGLPTMVLRFIPEYKARGDWARLCGVIRISWQLTFVTSLVLSLLGTVTVLWLNAYKGFEYINSLLLGVWMVPLLALEKLQSEMFRAIRRIALAYAPSMLLLPLLVIGGAFVYFQMSQMLTSVFIIGIAMLALLTVVVIQLWLLRRALALEIYQTYPIYETHEWLRVSLPLLLISGFYVILNQTDTLMVGALLGSREVGIYSAASKTARSVSFVLVAVDAIAAPMLASLYAQTSHEGLQRLVSTVAHLLFWPSLAFTFFLIVFAEPVLGLFGSEFVAARWEMVILALGWLVNAGAGPVGYLMIMTGYQNQSAYVFGWSALANIVLNAISIPSFGIMGAALATAMTMALWNIWLHILVVKNLDIWPSVIKKLRI
jgi:O-antigen/teichoic acid export membrane protein